MFNTKIEYCDGSFNPWVGCAPVSKGCDNCFARRATSRWDRWRDTFGPTGIRKRTSEDYWNQVRVLDRKCARLHVRASLLCGTWCDPFELFHQGDAWRADLWQLILETTNIDWLLLTKRPHRIAPIVRLQNENTRRAIDFSKHIWYGTSVEDQLTANRRTTDLLINLPQVHRFARTFLSCEPLLGPTVITLDYGAGGRICNYAKIHSVIAGGETGPTARPMNADWPRAIRDQCQAASIPFFFKQWSAAGQPMPDRSLDGVFHSATDWALGQLRFPQKSTVARASRP